jgi:hypothetical protein
MGGPGGGGGFGRAAVDDTGDGVNGR